MDKRKNLHDYSLLLIFLSVLDVFSFVATVIAGIVDGTVSDALATVEADMLTAVKIGLVVAAVLMALLAFAEVFIGIKGLKVSREPSADKGYIIATKIFFVLSIVASISFFVTFFDGNAPIVDTILNFANAVLDIAVYAIFIKAANAVRADFIAENK